MNSNNIKTNKYIGQWVRFFTPDSATENLAFILKSFSLITVK